LKKTSTFQPAYIFVFFFFNAKLSVLCFVLKHSVARELLKTIGHTKLFFIKSMLVERMFRKEFFQKSTIRHNDVNKVYIAPTEL